MVKRLKSSSSSKQFNSDYFESLIATRASIGMLGIAWAGILVGALETMIVWMTGLDAGWNPPYDPATLTSLMSLLFMACLLLSAIVEPLRKLFYQHQRFSSIWQMVFVVILFYQLSFMAFIMVISQENRLMIYGSPLTVPYLLFAGVFYLLCYLYNIT